MPSKHETPLRRLINRVLVGRPPQRARRDFDSAPTPLRASIPDRGSLPTRWSAVALFQTTPEHPLTAEQAAELLDLAGDACAPTVSEFMGGYLSTLSQGLVAPRLEPVRLGRTIARSPAATPAEALRPLAQTAWRAAGSITHVGVRRIPILVWVHAGPSAPELEPFELQLGAHTYRVDACLPIHYSLERQGSGRSWWGPLCAAVASALLSVPVPAEGARPGAMPEVPSDHKCEAGWLTFKQLLQGPTLSPRMVHLAPYTESGEAYKIVPDPRYRPDLYFLVEYRSPSSTGDATPDGSRTASGLLITRVDARAGTRTQRILWTGGARFQCRAVFDPGMDVELTLSHIELSVDECSFRLGVERRQVREARTAAQTGAGSRSNPIPIALRKTG